MDRMEHLEYTYEKSCAYDQEPPPPGVVEFNIQAESKVDSEF